MQLGFSICAVALFSVLAHWRMNPLAFMVAAGCSVAVGYYWFDTYTNTFGLAVSIMFILYAFVCLGYTMASIWTIFQKRKDDGGVD